MKYQFSIHCKQKKENEILKNFVDFYASSFYSDQQLCDIDCPDFNKQFQMPDYYIKQLGLLIEIKEIHDKKELEQSAIWINNIERFKNNIRGRDMGLLSCGYHVHTPALCGRVGPKKENEIIDLLFDGIRRGQKDVHVKGVGRFKIAPLKEVSKGISFGFGSGGSMNSASTISENIGHKISKANDQLGASVILPVHKKILLLKNQWWGGNNPKDFREALAGYYDVLLSCQNIDEIWLQFNNRDGEILHELIYTRDFITSYNKGRISITPQNTELFRKWFYYLSQQGDTMKSLLFTNMKSIISSKKPDSIFSDNQSREMMVKLGEWLAEKDRYDDLIWIIEKFIDDSDPPDPNNYNVESELDFHRQIENGEDPVTINTVLGQLAWVILKLSLKKEYIKKALNFTNILLSHNNLYVKYQALFPLMEISARRQWLDGYGKRPYEGSYKEFHDIVFGILSLLETHPKYVAISSHFVEIFSYYKDLTTEEALRVVKVLKNTETSASLFIYFAMFRERHYKDQNMDFDSSPFVVELDSILAGTDDEFRALRVNIAWNLWKLLSEEPNEFPNVKKFIDILVSRQPYSRDLFTNMEMIIEDHVSTHPDECINWFDNMLDKIELYMSSNVDDQRGVWLSCSEKVIEEIAKRGNANRLVDVISKLIKLWEKGAYIGQIDQLFLSFKLIPESEKQDVKNQFKRIYKRMKEGQPKLTDVAWD